MSCSEVSVPHHSSSPSSGSYVLSTPSSMMFPELRLERGKMDVPFVAERSPLILITMASHERLQLLYPL